MTHLTLFKDLGTMYPTKNSKEKKRFGLYMCSCGSMLNLRVASVIGGHTKSCGCHRKHIVSKLKTTHGATKDRIYKIWAGIGSISPPLKLKSPDLTSSFSTNQNDILFSLY